MVRRSHTMTRSRSAKQPALSTGNNKRPETPACLPCALMFQFHGRMGHAPKLTAISLTPTSTSPSSASMMARGSSKAVVYNDDEQQHQRAVVQGNELCATWLHVHLRRHK